jgi:hypothetical protein
MMKNNSTDWQHRSRIQQIAELDQLLAEATHARNLAMLNQQFDAERAAVRVMRSMRRLIRKLNGG